MKAQMLALGLALWATAGWAGGEPGVEVEVQNGQVRFHLPAGEAGGPLQRLERIDDLSGGIWRPIARTGAQGDWEAVQPDPRAVAMAGEAGVVTEPAGDGAAFYRVTTAAETPALTAQEAAARFLTQATFGPKRAEIDALAAGGNDFAGWIEAQKAIPATLHTTLWKAPAYQNLTNPGTTHHRGMIWFDATIRGQDQLRQRMAWALSQILVMGESGSTDLSTVEDWVDYYDIFVAHAFGNYRTVLQEVTLHARMGEYLTYRGNRKASGAQLPDENYAREVMQLFTIGLWELNPDGTHKMDAEGHSIPTYDNDDILQFARIFTGLDRAPKRPGEDAVNRVDPMVATESRHDTGEKTLLDGSKIAPGGTTLGDIGLLLDHLFQHANTGPFICRQLIQRMTTSNPSPGYVGRVAAVFANNGAGVRGDLGAVAKAILLDPEARAAHYLADDGHGLQREPLLKFTHLARAFGLASTRGDNLLRIQSLEQHFGQFPYRSPSVFNFYLPDYQAPGGVTDRGLVSPEFQIYDDSTALAGSNVFYTLVYDGLKTPVNSSGSAEGALDYTAEKALATDVPALLDHLDLLLARGTLCSASRALIREAVEAVPASQTTNRVKLAVALLSLTPEFNILQ